MESVEQRLSRIIKEWPRYCVRANKMQVYQLFAEIGNRFAKADPRGPLQRNACEGADAVLRVIKRQVYESLPLPVVLHACWQGTSPEGLTSMLVDEIAQQWGSDKLVDPTWIFDRLVCIVGMEGWTTQRAGRIIAASRMLITIIHAGQRQADGYDLQNDLRCCWSAMLATRVFVRADGTERCYTLRRSSEPELRRQFIPPTWRLRHWSPGAAFIDACDRADEDGVAAVSPPRNTTTEQRHRMADELEQFSGAVTQASYIEEVGKIYVVLAPWVSDDDEIVDIEGN